MPNGPQTVQRNLEAKVDKLADSVTFLVHAITPIVGGLPRDQGRKVRDALDGAMKAAQSARAVGRETITD